MANDKRRELLALAEQIIMEYLGDDADFPCYWMDRLIAGDPDLVEDFVDEVLTWEVWAELVQEAGDDETPFFYSDIERIARAVEEDNIKQWNDLPMEQKALYMEVEA